MSSGGSGMEEDGSSGRKFRAEPLRGSAEDSSQSTLGGEAVVGPVARAAGPARGVVGPTGPSPAKCRGTSVAQSLGKTANYCGGHLGQRIPV